MRSLIRPTMLSGAGALAAILAGSAASAAVTISTAATSNMSCVSGICTPTATNAVLNVDDLTTMLASGSVKLAAAGEPVDVDIAAPLSWVSTNTLTLDSYHSINVQQRVAITGGGGLALITNDGGTGGEFSFAPTANVAIWSLLSSLTINGSAYTLVDDIAALASDVTANPSGSYALAGNYNAMPDGIYSISPISTHFAGNFQGLGNTIANLTISSTAKVTNTGLFSWVSSGAAISNVILQNAAITTFGSGSNVGGVIAFNEGTLFGDHVGGDITGAEGSQAGGLSGVNLGVVMASSSSATVAAPGKVLIGGLIGQNEGTVDECFATGSATGTGHSGIGSLIGYQEAGAISNSYATGSAKGGGNSYIGGFVGMFQDTSISTSYSTGAAKGGQQSEVGGFIGDYTGGALDVNSYWDTTTSGRTKAAGNQKKLSGVKGETSAQLQSGLPTGFDPTIWAQSPSINNGFPYLIANPPQ